MRLFVAVFPPDEVCRDLRRHLTGAGGRRVRLTPVERWHITLAFLGDVASERQPEVERALGAVTVPAGVRLRLRGGGRFGSGRSSALWAGVEDESAGAQPDPTRGELATLNVAVREQLRAAGLPFDERPWTPHLTVAYADDHLLLAALDRYAGPSWQLRDMALVRSVPGAGYTTLERW